MAKKRELVDDVLDAILWMRRKSKKREAVDDFVESLFAMRRNTVKLGKKVKKQEKQPRLTAPVKAKKPPPKNKRR